MKKENKTYKDKNNKVIKLHDICKEDIYMKSGEKIGEIIVRIVKHEGIPSKKVIADNGGVGYILKNSYAPLKENNPYLRVIGYNYQSRQLQN